MTKYVVGFMFNSDRTKVALIRKNRPKWQAGKLNGIGGHIEARESPRDAMEREFFEETGVFVPKHDWERVGYMERDEDFVCYIFRYFSKNCSLVNLQSKTDEIVEIHGTNDLSESLSNVPWLIGMCLDTSPGDFNSYQIKATIGTVPAIAKEVKK